MVILRGKDGRGMGEVEVEAEKMREEGEEAKCRATDTK